jgi:hypothetical protein
VHFTLGTGSLAKVEPKELPADLSPTPKAISIDAQKNWFPLTDIAGSVTGAERDKVASLAAAVTASSSVVSGRQKAERTIELPGLFRHQADAHRRVSQLRDWFEGGLSAFEIATDRYLNQIEIGHICNVEYDYYDLDGSVDFTVIAWRENVGAQRIDLTVVG